MVEAAVVVLFDGFSVVAFEGTDEVILFAVFVVVELVVTALVVAGLAVDALAFDALAVDAVTVVALLTCFVVVAAVAFTVLEEKTVAVDDGEGVELSGLFVVLTFDCVLFDERFAATVCWMKLVIANVLT